MDFFFFLQWTRVEAECLMGWIWKQTTFLYQIENWNRPEGSKHLLTFRTLMRLLIAICQCFNCDIDQGLGKVYTLPLRARETRNDVSQNTQDSWCETYNVLVVFEVVMHEDFYSYSRLETKVRETKVFSYWFHRASARTYSHMDIGHGRYRHLWSPSPRVGCRE